MSSKTNCNRTIDQCFQKKTMVECPVKFSFLFIEEHAADYNQNLTYYVLTLLMKWMMLK